MWLRILMKWSRSQMQQTAQSLGSLTNCVPSESSWMTGRSCMETPTPPTMTSAMLWWTPTPLVGAHCNPQETLNHLCLITEENSNQVLSVICWLLTIYKHRKLRLPASAVYKEINQKPNGLFSDLHVIREVFIDMYQEHWVPHFTGQKIIGLWWVLFLSYCLTTVCFKETFLLLLIISWCLASFTFSTTMHCHIKRQFLLLT